MQAALLRRIEALGTGMGIKRRDPAMNAVSIIVATSIQMLTFVPLWRRGFLFTVQQRLRSPTV